MSPKIAIIGAGPAGLLLARLLQINNIPATVFEREPNFDSRDQGGTIDLHERGGQLALREAGLIEEFKRLSRPEAEVVKLLKFDGTVIADENVSRTRRAEEYSGRPEIDRVVLRGLLLESLRPGTVVWGRNLRSVEKSPKASGTYDLHFADGVVEERVDLVVGADGAWSKVRPLLTEQKPFYSSVTTIELWATEVDEQHPWLSTHVGKGSCFMFDEGRAIMSQVNGNNSIRTYAAVREPETWLTDCGIDWTKPDEAREALIQKHFADCAEDVKRVIRESVDGLIPRQLYMLPIGLKWESQPGVTLVGDAAHLMTPFAGVGVNLALLDSLDLAKAVVAAEKQEPLADAIKEYEAQMFKRAEQFARKTWAGLENHFSATGGEEMARRALAH
jgi:2-polyprenyl-6-methoxyphenol hydroxylase-like FAD-dependent oxidoreductase